MSYPESLIRRRPRRTMDHLFGDDADLETIAAAIDPDRKTRPAPLSPQLPPGVVPWNPDAGITRPRRVLPPVAPAPQPRTDEFAPYEGQQPAGTFMGDAPVLVNRALPPARPDMPVDLQPVQPPLAPMTLANIGAPPAAPPTPDYITQDAAELRRIQSAPVERSRAKSAGVGFLRGGIPGLIGGVLQPEMYGEMKRSRAIKRAEDLLGTDLDLRKARNQDALLQSQIDENTSQAEARRRPPRPKLVEQVLPDGTSVLAPEAPGLVTGRPKATAPMVPMKLSDGRTVMVSPSSALGADATRTGRDERVATKADERERQRLEAEDEFDRLTSDETAAGDEKNRAYAYLKSLKANPSVSEDDIREATRAAEAANTFYRSFGPKKSAAKAKAARYSAPTRPDRPGGHGKAAPATHSFSIGAYMQRNKGTTPADARAYAAANYSNYDVDP